MTMRARLDTEGSATDLTRALIDIPSVSGSESALADAIESLLASCAHLEVLRDGDAAAPGLTLERIGPRAAVFSLRGLSFELPL